MNEKLTKIAVKVFENNPGHLYTPETLFAEYVEHFDGFDIEIDSKPLSEYILCFFEEGSASLDEYPMYTLKLDNLTKDEYVYFYQQLKDIFEKISDATDEKWLKDTIKAWLDQLGGNNEVSASR